MGDYNFTTGTQEVVELGNRVMKAQNTVSFAAHNCTAAGGVCEVLSIPAGAVVTNFYCIISTAEGGTATADFGDGDDPNGYDDAVNLNAAAGTMTTSVVADAYGYGRYYSAADTIDISLDNDCDAAIIKVVVKYFMVE